MPGFEIFGDQERREVQDVLDSGVLFRYGFDHQRNGHWKAKAFEAEMCARTGATYCHLCANGTLALTAALAACGIGLGDEVIVPPFTFIATIEAVLNAGAVPVFADIDDTLCLDPRRVEAVLTPRTKAVLPVHMCGAMARIDDLQEVCRLHGLTLIEDACQSMGATFNGKSAGTFGRIGCFSFDAVKTVTCGEGGAVVTDDEALYATVDAYADHGHDHRGTDRGLEAHAILGTNLRISELNAAVGIAQLSKLDTMLARQREHKAVLRQALSRIPEVTFREIPDPAGDSATFLSFFLPNLASARKAIKALGRSGVDGCFHWFDNNWHYIRNWQHLKQLSTAAKLPIHLSQHLKNYNEMELDQSDHIMGKTISILIKLAWTERELLSRAEKIVSAVKQCTG